MALNSDKKKRGEALEAYPIEDKPPDEIQDEIHGARPLGHVEPERPKRSSAPASWRRTAGTARGSKDPAPIEHPGPREPITCPGPPGDPGPTGGGSGPSGGDASGSRGGPSEPAPDGIQGVRAKDLGPKDPKVAWEWIDGLDGCKVAFKMYKHPIGKSYPNYRIQCTNPAHDGCAKVKGEIPKLMNKYGPIGPLAFLHAWLSLDHTEDKLHNVINPSDAAVQAYAAAHADELKEVMERAKAASI